MPDWNDILNEIKEYGSIYDIARRRYIKSLSNLTGRNTIIYYSGWLQKPNLLGVGIDDNDKIGFMSTIRGMDRDKGLDLILHTPGGEVSATESLVDYLRSMFKSIRVIVPQLAMSAGTMISCASDCIVMGKQSSLGPIDPQFRGIPAHGVVEEFKKAHQEIKADPSKISVWQPIIAKYNPTFIGECEKAIVWAEEIVLEWLQEYMFKDHDNKLETAQKILGELADHSVTKSHSRHYSAKRCIELGLKVEMMENDNDFQDAILSLHHACIHSLSSTDAVKIIESQNNKAFIQSIG